MIEFALTDKMCRPREKAKLSVSKFAISKLFLVQKFDISRKNF